LGRDDGGLFRSIDVGIDFPNVQKARDTLRTSMRKLIASGQTVFPQDRKPKKKTDIYKPVVPVNRLHPFFAKLANEARFSSAKEIIGELIYSYEDPDGNYIEQFQTTGFNARLWELYLHAYLHEEEFYIERTYQFPDYMCRKFDQVVFIEAVTVNPSSNQGLVEERPKSKREVDEKLRDYMPIKFGSALYSKLNKKYWEREHVQGHPLVFAIQDFHQERSMIWSSMALPTYLYGVRHSWRKDADGNLEIIPEYIEKHKYGDKEIPSGFFFQPEAENISAILFSNSATISKFNRMGKLAGFGDSKIIMIRMGARHNHDPNAVMPLPFRVTVDPSSYDEMWADGLSMYHNPNALQPIDPQLFPNIAHHIFEDGQIISTIPEIYIYNSFTFLIQPNKRT